MREHRVYRHRCSRLSAVFTMSNCNCNSTCNCIPTERLAGVRVGGGRVGPGGGGRQVDREGGNSGGREAGREAQ